MAHTRAYGTRATGTDGKSAGGLRTRNPSPPAAAAEPPLDCTPLLQFTECLAGQTHGVGWRFVQAVDGLSQARARLVLRPERPFAQNEAAARQWIHSAPVRFRSREYGIVFALAAEEKRGRPAPLSYGETLHLAAVCALALALLEQSALVAGLVRRLPLTPVEPLTAREREVLTQMVEQADPARIASALRISRKTVNKHMEHIYTKLQAHSLVDAILIAHRAGMTSFLRDPLDAGARDAALWPME